MKHLSLVAIIVLILLSLPAPAQAQLFVEEIGADAPMCPDVTRYYMTGMSAIPNQLTFQPGGPYQVSVHRPWFANPFISSIWLEGQRVPLWPDYLIAYPGDVIVNENFFQGFEINVCQIPPEPTATPVPPSPTTVTPPDDCYLLTSGEGEGEFELTEPSTLSVFGGEVWIVQGPVTGPVQTGFVYPAGLYGVDVTLSQGSGGVQVVVCPEPEPEEFWCETLAEGRYDWEPGTGPWLSWTLPISTTYVRYQVATNPPALNLYFLDATNAFVPPTFGLSWPVAGVREITTEASVHIGDTRGGSGFGDLLIEACNYNPGNPPTPTPTIAMTPTSTGTVTAVPATPTRTTYPTRTPTTTRTPTPTRTQTVTPTPNATRPPLSCPVATSLNIPVAPSVANVYFAAGVEFGVVGASVLVNIGPGAEELPPGVYRWDQPAGMYSVFSLTDPATLWLCATALTSTPTSTATNMPTLTTTSIGIGETAVCIPVQTPTMPIGYVMPDLSLDLPTMAPFPTINGSVTATPAFSTTAIAAFFRTIEAGVSTPAASLQTVTAGYTWQSGSFVAATSVAVAAPALTWLSILNPAAPAWQTEGGPLWALSPLIMPILPIFILLFIVLTIRFVLWMVAWLLKLIDLVIKLIELIPGM